MKSFTDIEQSKKLAEILPHESADMIWYGAYCGMGGQYHLLSDEYNEFGLIAINKEFCKTLFKLGDEYVDWLPCWSLSALLDVLPNEIITDNRFECHYQIDIRKYDWYDNTTLYQIAYGNNRGLSGSWHDMVNTGEKENLIDCCVQMIINLHEQKLL